LHKRLGCFVLGVAHLGRDQQAGVRGATSKEASADVVWACLGDRELSGAVLNTRLAIRKNRAGRQGQQYPFVLREVQAEPDEDGDPQTTLVVDWTNSIAVPEAQPKPPEDPWRKGIRRLDQLAAMQRLKGALMDELKAHGEMRPIEPDGPAVCMVAEKTVRAAFYARTPGEDGGTAKQEADRRRMQFDRARDWAEAQGLIGIRETEGTSQLWLTRQN
jgi:hypothetical protein